MDSMELLVYSIVGVFCALGIAAAIAYRVAGYIDRKKHDTDIKAR